MEGKGFIEFSQQGSFSYQPELIRILKYTLISYVLVEIKLPYIKIALFDNFINMKINFIL